MGQIKILPPDVVNRIAAGEVIERPASVVKELVENAIDSGATEILVEVEAGGERRIRVRDNGGGIAPEDLPLAFRSHATSKLWGPAGPESRGGTGGEGADDLAFDLFRIGTLGFRGEALASIASVAEIEAVSRPPEAELAHRYLLRGSEASGDGPVPVAGPSGTSIEVRNLFFNTPARRKFLRSGSTELSHIVEQLTRLALGFPGIRFSLASGGKRVLDCPPSSSLRERLGAILGRERAGELLEVPGPAATPAEERGERVKVRGFVGPPSLHRNDARGQHFFVNGRWVRDRVITHALQEAYRGFQIPGRRPVAYLFVEVPPGQVDVNVHPTKCEVRFLDSGAVHRAVLAAVRGALERKGPGSEGSAAAPSSSTAAARASSASAATLPAPEALERVREAAIDFFRSAKPPGPSAGGPAESRGRPPAESIAAKSPGAEGDRRHSPESGPGPAARPAEEGILAGAPVQPRRRAPLQLLRTFLLLETEEGILLFDQHALHEKILFEEILARLRSGSMPRQQLLLPEVVDLPPELLPLLEEAAEHLRPLGFEVELFGPRQAAVRAVPAVLGDAPAAPIVLEAARWLRDGFAGGGGGEGAAARSDPKGDRSFDPGGDRLRSLAQMVACKRAVKAGMELEAAELEALMRGAAGAIDPRFCPHGRPTGVFISRAELERRFDRK